MEDERKTEESGKEENGSSIVAVDEDSEAMVGPGPAPQARRKRPLQFEQAYLDALPSANMYVYIHNICI